MISFTIQLFAYVNMGPSLYISFFSSHGAVRLTSQLR
jgi:hypothetical protein